jgi:hypothetical protein
MNGYHDDSAERAMVSKVLIRLLANMESRFLGEQQFLDYLDKQVQFAGIDVNRSSFLSWWREQKLIALRQRDAEERAAREGKVISDTLASLPPETVALLRKHFKAGG